ncbi:unnamed protein product, partial [Schistosoma mattheei]
MLQHINSLKPQLINHSMDGDEESTWFTERMKKEEKGIDLWKPMTEDKKTESLELIDRIETPPPTPSTSNQNLLETSAHDSIHKDDSLSEFLNKLEDIASEPSEDEQLWTIIYRGPPPKFVKGTHVIVILINKTDHYHFVFQSSTKNRFRTIRNILNAGGVKSDVGATLQPVRNWFAFMKYLQFKTNYTAELIGT